MTQNLAVSLIKQFKASGIQIPKLQISNIGGLTCAATCEGTSSTVMVNDSAAGMDFDPDLAISKALVEYLERMAFRQGIDSGDPICSRLHSDGIAAFPRLNAEAPRLARQNAYFEALERYVWATWWDNKAIGHTAVDLLDSSFGADRKIAATFERLNEILPIQSTRVVEPLFDGQDASVIILLSRIHGHGYITGGAAGPISQRRAILVRAMSELIRHGLAMARFINTRVEPMSFYEKRLLYFGMGHGNSFVENRLAANTSEVVRLPDLEIDSELKSSQTDPVIATHRCLFRSQPPFVDGELERLCL